MKRPQVSADMKSGGTSTSPSCFPYTLRLHRTTTCSLQDIPMPANPAYVGGRTQNGACSQMHCTGNSQSDARFILHMMYHIAYKTMSVVTKNGYSAICYLLQVCNTAHAHCLP